MNYGSLLFRFLVDKVCPMLLPTTIFSSVVCIFSMLLKSLLGIK
jgi:hypothetical protein